VNIKYDHQAFEEGLSVNHIALHNKTKHLNIILLRHIISRYRVMSDIYMHFMSVPVILL